MGIPVEALIADFQRMYSEKWAYVLGSAKTGEVDCSGAFVWAFRQFGRSIAHGSNAIARSYVTELRPVSEAKPGWAAFKLRKPGHNAYNLPEKYKAGSDLNDYYHIGLVDADGQHVLNAQGTKAGFTRTKLSAWSCVGPLKAVDYSETPSEGGESMDYLVTAPNGGTVRVRVNPSESATIVKNLKTGTKVSGIASAEGWHFVSFDGGNGYMMSKFLTPVSEPDEDLAYVKTLTPDEFNRLCEMRDQLTEMRKQLTAIVGEG